jgi:hypothetical protein
MANRKTPGQVRDGEQNYAVYEASPIRLWSTAHCKMQDIQENRERAQKDLLYK